MNKLTFRLHIIRLYPPHVQVASTKEERNDPKKEERHTTD